MSRCFSNDNIEPIKNSKEYIEAKRNDSLFCNYANNFWRKTGINIPHGKQYEEKVDSYGKFQVNNKNKIEKANNHENYLRLSKGIFQRTVMMSKYALNREKWAKRKELNKLKKENLFPLKSINSEEIKYDVSHNSSDFMYFSGSVFDGTRLNYLQKSNTLLDKSIFSVKTSDITIDDTLGKKVNYVPYCFNLHNTKYNLETTINTSADFLAGYLLCGNFNQTTKDPFKSKNGYTLSQSNEKVSDDINWSFVENSYNWGTTTDMWTKDEYLTLSTPATNLTSWTLMFSIKFSYFQTIGESINAGRTNLQKNIILVKFGNNSTDLNWQGIQIFEDKLKILGITFDTYDDGSDFSLQRGLWYNIAFTAKNDDFGIYINNRKLKNSVVRDNDWISKKNLYKSLVLSDLYFFRDTTSGNDANTPYNNDSGYIKNLFLFNKGLGDIAINDIYNLINNYTIADS
jgi:hypothetical protein